MGRCCCGEGTQRQRMVRCWLVALVLLVSVDGAVLSALEAEARAVAGLEVSAANRFVSALQAASEELAETEADSEFGGGVAVRATPASGPGTLEEYCSGAGTGMQAKARVEADWKGYGMMYPGVIEKVHEDGTVDVLYDDGWTETHLDPANVKKIEEGPAAMKPKDDPVCQLKEFVVEVQEEIATVHEHMDQWVQGLTDGGVTTPEPSTTEAKPQAAPAGAAPGSDAFANKTTELERLKAELAAKDEEIQQLGGEVKGNDDRLQDELATNSTEAPTDSIDDLIAEYRQKIVLRDQQIERLRKRLQEQQEQLEAAARANAARPAAQSPITLADIQKEVQELSSSVAEARVKRDQLVKDNKMDPELRRSLDGIIQDEASLRKQISVLVELEKQAMAQREVASLEATHTGRQEASAQAEQTEAKVFEAARQVEEDLRDMLRGTQELNTGVHPHGAKWWRYRYERSYVEALLMVLISILALLWERGYYYVRSKVYMLSNISTSDVLTHGTMYIEWLEFFSAELMVCLLTFTTCWVLAQFNAYEVLPAILQENDKLHLPKSGEEYQRMALDLCIVFVFAMIFYYILMLSVVHSTTQALWRWVQLEQLDGSTSGRTLHLPGALQLPRGRSIFARTLSRLRSESQEVTIEEVTQYQHLRQYFMKSIQADHELLEAIREDGAPPFDPKEFPVWVYLRRSVRAKVDRLFQFGWTVWLMLVLTFVTLTLLHRFAHMGYHRIMGTFAVLLIALLCFMGFWMTSINSFHETADAESGPAPVGWIHKRISTESAVLFMLHYLGVFICYGAARMVCQPYMWELHFWSVLGLSFGSLLAGALFAWVIAPLIPTFAMVMSFPPYVDPDDVAELRWANQYENKYSAGRLPAPASPAAA